MGNLLHRSKPDKIVPREALREHLKRLQTTELEARDRKGYQQHPEASTEVVDWEQAAAWPER